MDRSATGLKRTTVAFQDGLSHIDDEAPALTPDQMFDMVEAARRGTLHGRPVASLRKGGPRAVQVQVYGMC